MLRIANLAVLFVCVGVSTTCNPDQGSSDQSTPVRLQLVEDLRLDANVEDFSALNRVYVGPFPHNIVAPLPQDMNVRIYDSTGTRISTVGRRGSGPGEFRFLGAMGWVGDTLFVSDGRQRRLTYVGPDGNVLRTRSFPHSLAMGKLSNVASDSSFWSFEPFAVYPDGSMLGWGLLSLAPPGGITVSAGLPPADWVFVVMSAAGDARLVARFPRYHDERWMMTIAGSTKPVPFAFQPKFAVAPDGSFFAFLIADQSMPEGGTYTVSLFRASGDTVFSRSYPYVGVRVPKNARDSAIAAIAKVPVEGPSELTRRFQELARRRIPPVYAPVERVTLGLDSTLWIDLRPSSDGAITLILDKNGDPIGTILVPPRSRIHQASRGFVWMTEIDEFDLTSIVRYRIMGWSSKPSARAKKHDD